MNRYNVEKTIKVKDKRGRLLDGFDMIAHEFYGDVTLWWIIAKANIMIHGTLAVEPGIKLRIPIDTETILNNFYRLNS